MAVRAFLTSVPVEIYQSVRQSNGFEPNTDVLGKDYAWAEFRRIGIDTTWYTLHRIFSRSGYPLAYALEGDYRPGGGLEHFSNTDDGNSYLAYASVRLVEDVARALDEFPIRQELFEFEKDALLFRYFLDYFNDLVSFYRDVARKGEAVFISIG